MSVHDERDDDLHDPALRRLYRELPPELPSPDTDARLRAAARRAVAAGPRAAGRPFLSAHWRALGASAAAVLLGVALTAQWRGGEPGRLAEALATHKDAAPLPEASPDSMRASEAATPVVPAPPPSGATTSPRRARAERMTGANAGDTGEDAVAADSGHALADSAGGAVAGLAAPGAPAAAREEARAAAPAATEVPALAAEKAAVAEKAKAVAEAEMAPAAQGNVAGAVARPRSDALARPEAKKAERFAAAPAAAAPLGQATPSEDYRSLMAAGRPALALAALPAPDTAILMLDRDLIRQWQAPGTTPACASAAPAWLGAQALLCDALRDRAANAANAAAWPARLEAEGLLDGELSYRRPAINALFPKIKD